jgi:hypothetical protein
MAYRLRVDLKAQVDRLFDKFLKYVPKNFSDIPAIKEVEDWRFKLLDVNVADVTYRPNQLRQYVEDIIRHRTSGRNAIFVFDYCGTKHKIYGNVYLEKKLLKVDFDARTWLELKEIAEATAPKI